MRMVSDFVISVMRRLPERDLPLFYDLAAAHIWSEHLRDHYTAVFLLEVLEYGCYCTAYRESGSVESVNEFRLRVLVSLEADVGASCLEVFEVRAA